jgi:hypothetical protein
VAAGVVGVVTAIALLLSLVGWWAVAVVFDEEQVADIAVDTVTDPAVVDDVARAIVDDALVLFGAQEVFDEAARDAMADELVALLDQPVVAEVVHDVVVVAHRGAMHVLSDGELVPGVSVQGDAVVVNLLPLWSVVLELATDLDLPTFDIGGDPEQQLAAMEAALGLDLADDAGQVVLFRSDTLGEVGGWVDLVRRIITVVQRGVVLTSLVALVGVAGTVLLARRRRRAGVVLVAGVVVGCLLTLFVAGRVVAGSTAIVSDPALAAVIHGSIDQAAQHLERTLWWSMAVLAVIAVLLVPWRRRTARPAAVAAPEAA